MAFNWNFGTHFWIRNIQQKTLVPYDSFTIYRIIKMVGFQQKTRLVMHLQGAQRGFDTKKFCTIGKTTILR